MRRLRRGLRRIFGLSIGLALVVALSGCVGHIQRVDLVGRWVHEGNSDQYVEFRPDGSVSVAGLPTRLLPALFPEGGTSSFSGVGRWMVENSGLNTSRITLEFEIPEQGRYVSFDLFAARTIGSWSLNLPIGDPDAGKNFRYRRVSTPPTGRS